MLNVDAGDDTEGQKNGWELKLCSYVFCNFQKKKPQISTHEVAHLTSLHKEMEPSFTTYLNDNWVPGTALGTQNTEGNSLKMPDGFKC